MSHKRGGLVVAALAAVLAAVAIAAPGFFAADNLRDVGLGVVPVLVAAIGMTLVIVSRQIDISIGSQFAIGGVVAGALAQAGAPMPLVILGVLLSGALLGAVNGILVAGCRIPSIVATLATMAAWREGLRWITQGAPIRNLDHFQWFGLSQGAGRAALIAAALALFAAFAWATRFLAAARAVYAVGSDPEAARLAGIRPARVTFGVFVLMGVLASLAALFSSIRFPIVPSTSGQGFELQVIAAVVVGGTAISGGRGTLAGTLGGVLLLGVVGTALMFLHVSSTWEKAIQGAILLAAVAADAVEIKKKTYARALAR